MKKLPLFLLSTLFLLPSFASSATSPSLMPTATGTYSEWKPATGVTHYTTVDETPCNGLTDYVATTTLAKRDSFIVSLSSIPNNSIISAIAIAPCASRATTGTGSSVLNVFYRWSGINSSDLGSYAPSGTTPTNLATSTWSSLSFTKTSTSTLEIGMIYTSGAKGARLSHISTQLTYGQLPSATTSAASSITTTSALLNGTGNPNGTTTTAWFRIATSSPGTCNDTFGTRVPLSGSTNLGAGTSSFAYSTTTSILTQNTTYYYCAIASSGYGKGYGAVQSFTTASAVTLISSNITTNQTWTTASGTYIVTTAIEINSGITLTINPGVVVKFNGAGSAITVNGTLNAQGSTSSKVYFTSYKDDAINGDTNSDGTATSPYNGDWRYLYTPVGGVSIINHTVIRYGGAFGEGQINVYGGRFTLTNSEVATSSSYGLANDNNGILTIGYSDIHDNGATTSTTYFGIRHLKGTTTIDHSIIRNNANYGVWSAAGVQVGNMYLTNNTFTDSRGGAALIYLGNTLNFVHYNNVSTGGGKGGIVIHGAPDSNQTWYGDPYLPYIINSATGTVTFTSARTVTVGAGAIFKFEGTTAMIDVGYGNLVANSSASTSKIYFTSIKDDTVGGDTNGNGSANSAAAGDWDAIRIGSIGSSTLNNVVVRYGGNTVSGSSKMVWNTGILTVINSEFSTSTIHGIYTTGTLSVASSTFQNNGQYGIYGNMPILLIIATSTFYGHTMAAGYVNLEYAGPFITNGNTATNNARNGFIVRGTLANNQTFQADIPYVASSTAGNIIVAAGKTLTINPGAIMKFDGAGAGILVSGTLNALAGSGFTSIVDDGFKGDTNNNGSVSSAAAGDWERIGFLSGSTGNITQAFVYYGGSLSTSGMISNSGGTVNIDRSFIQYSKYRGLYNSSGTLTSTGAFLHANDIGLYHSGGTTNIANNGNRFSSSTSYGIYNSTGVTLNAEMNFWVPHSSSATTTGAYHATLNSTGNGDTVSGDVDFTPWKVNLFSDLADAVDGGEIRWGGTTNYWDPWYGAVSTWDVLGSVDIASSTGCFCLEDLTLSDLYAESAGWVGLYTPDGDDGGIFEEAADIQFNSYYMSNASTTAAEKLAAATHELGHALGLGHSYVGNIMLDYVSSQTTLGVQDLFDYNTLW